MVTPRTRTRPDGAPDAAARPQLFQLTVDTVGPGTRLIRAVGTLDRGTAARLLRLVDAQLALVRGGRRAFAGLVLDLAGIRHFEEAGVQALRHVRYSCARLGIAVHLTGGTERGVLLPVRARQVLGEFSNFPTVEVAVTALEPAAARH